MITVRLHCLLNLVVSFSSSSPMDIQKSASNVTAISQPVLHLTLSGTRTLSFTHLTFDSNTLITSNGTVIRVSELPQTVSFSNQSRELYLPWWIQQGCVEWGVQVEVKGREKRNGVCVLSCMGVDTY